MVPDELLAEQIDEKQPEPLYPLFASACLVTVGSFIGVLVRESFALPLTPGSTYYADLWPNFSGTFILSYLKALVMNYAPLITGIGTGFCGSLTTFASWMLSAAQFVGPLTPDVETGPRVLLWTEVMIIISSVSLMGWDLGKHLEFVKLCPVVPISKNADVFYFALSVTLFVVGIVAVTVITMYRPTSFMLAICWGPPGALIRWQLGLRLNSKFPTFPIGTFIANISAAVLLAMAYVIAFSGKAGNEGTIQCNVLAGFANGFCGSLSTVSTFIGELKSLDRQHAYLYGFASVGLAQVLMMIIIGTVTLSGTNQVIEGYCSI